MANKKNVYETYEKIVEWFDSTRNRTLFEKKHLDLIISFLKKGDDVLDLGCGTGEPIARYFIENGFNIIGVDGSLGMIDLAKKSFPKHQFIVQDMRDINFSKKFKAILAWDSFFHLPQNDQRLMFKIFDRHILDGGILAFTSGTYHGEVWNENGGENLYHASLSLDEYKALLQKHGFTIIKHLVDDPDCSRTVWITKKI